MGAVRIKSVSVNRFGIKIVFAANLIVTVFQLSVNILIIIAESDYPLWMHDLLYFSIITYLRSSLFK